MQLLSGGWIWTWTPAERGSAGEAVEPGRLLDGGRSLARSGLVWSGPAAAAAQIAGGSCSDGGSGCKSHSVQLSSVINSLSGHFGSSRTSCKH